MEIPRIIAGYVIGAITATIAIKYWGIVGILMLSLVALFTALAVKEATTVGNALGVLSVLLFLAL